METHIFWGHETRIAIAIKIMTILVVLREIGDRAMYVRTGTKETDEMNLT